MANCPKCGASVEDTAKFCNECGEKLTADTASGAGTANTTADAINDAVENIKKLNDTADTTADYDKTDIENNKILSLFSYLGLLFLIPLLAAPNSKYARFHTNQGIILFIVNLIVSIVTGILGAIVTLTTALGSIAGDLGAAIGAILGIVVGLIGSALGLVIFIFAIIGIVNAVTGKAKELPLIGKIRILK